MLAIYEQSSDTVEDNPHMTFTSTDNGVTWTRGPDLISEQALCQGRLLSPAEGVALHGDFSQSIESFYVPAVIARITVAGQSSISWGGAVEEAFLNSPADDFWEIHQFVDLGGDHIVAVGLVSFPPTPTRTNVFHSTDGGASWDSPTIYINPAAGAYTLRACAYATDTGTLLVGGFHSTASPRIYRSTDGGQTFSAAIALPSDGWTTGGHSVRAIAYLGNSVWLAGGTARSPSLFSGTPRLWRSTDDGQTWTEVTSGIADIPALFIAAANGVNWIQPLGNGDVLIDLCGDFDDAHTPFRLSTDNGVTFDNSGTYVAASQSSIAFRGHQMALADDGSVTASLRFSNLRSELWRIVVDGGTFVATQSLVVESETVIGCGVMPVVTLQGEITAALTVPSGLECVPSFIPPFCPPECPPASTPTFATPPAVATQAGYASILPILGLMLGGATGAVSVPAGCGPSFTSEPCDRVEIT